MAVGEVIGLAGAGLAGLAYVPQISHMVRERCVAGISRPAFLTWLVASALVLVSAVIAGSMVFITLGAVQTVATAFILGYAITHADCYCPSHPPAGSTTSA